MKNYLKLIENIHYYIQRTISDMILINQLPVSDKKESDRLYFLKLRMNEFGASKIEIDQNGNLYFILPGSKPTKDAILIFTTLDYPYYSPLESFVKLRKNKAIAKGVGNNSLGVASALSLVEFFLANNVEFPMNIVFLFVSIGNRKDDSEGLEFFLKNFPLSIRFALEIGGLHLGKIGYKTIGHYSFEISTKSRGGNIGEINTKKIVSATELLIQTASRIYNIGWPNQYETFLNISSISSGNSKDEVSTEGYLYLDLYSKDQYFLEYSKNIVMSTIEKCASDFNAKITTKILSFVLPHPSDENLFLVDLAKEVHQFLGIESKVIQVSDLSAKLLHNDIATISLGVTTGKSSLFEEYIDTAPIETGLKQIMMILDKGINSINKEELYGDTE